MNRVVNRYLQVQPRLQMVNWLDDKMPEIWAVTLRKAPRGRATVVKIEDETFHYYTS
jgi:hypothetical protein